MANVKITDLAALTNPASTDVLPIVDVGADVTKKISIADLLENAGSGTASAPGIAFDGDSNTGIYRPGPDQLAISSNGAQRLLIDSDGDINIDSGGVFYDATNNRLAIGTTAPLGILHARPADECNFVVREESTSLILSAETNSGRDNNRAMTLEGSEFVFNENGTERMRITSAGLVGIGTSAKLDGNAVSLAVAASFPNTPVEIQQDGTGSHYAITFRNGNGLVGSITTSGSATSFNTSSDYRLKENVVPLTGAADRLNQLQVHRFNFIADPDTTVDGFIAHEAQAVVPECVTGTKDEVDEDGNPIYQGIDQSKIVPLVVAALQEALAEIETLKARLAAAGIS